MPLSNKINKPISKSSFYLGWDSCNKEKVYSSDNSAPRALTAIVGSDSTETTFQLALLAKQAIYEGRPVIYMGQNSTSLENLFNERGLMMSWMSFEKDHPRPIPWLKGLNTESITQWIYLLLRMTGTDPFIVPEDAVRLAVLTELTANIDSPSLTNILNLLSPDNFSIALQVMEAQNKLSAELRTRLPTLESALLQPEYGRAIDIGLFIAKSLEYNLGLRGDASDVDLFTRYLVTGIELNPIQGSQSEYFNTKYGFSADSSALTSIIIQFITTYVEVKAVSNKEDYGNPVIIIDDIPFRELYSFKNSTFIHSFGRAMGASILIAASKQEWESCRLPTLLQSFLSNTEKLWVLGSVSLDSLNDILKLGSLPPWTQLSKKFEESPWNPKLSLIRRFKNYLNIKLYKPSQSKSLVFNGLTGTLNIITTNKE